MPFEGESYEHINLNDVDISMKTVEPNVYTLEINKLEPVYRTVKSPTSPLVGQSCLVLRGSFTIVDDENFSNRKLWQDFWTPFDGAKKDLKRILLATAVQQEPGQDLSDWANQFATLNPAARFQAPVTKEADKRDPNGPAVNRINFFQAKAC
jgi:hypothetical protein